MRKLIITLLLFGFGLTSCSQQRLGPGYEFTLFKNTSNWELAQAVDKEDEAAISKILKEKKINIDLQEPQFGGTLLMLAVSNGKIKSTRTLLEHNASLSITDSNNNSVIHDATEFIHIRKNVTQILELLLKMEQILMLWLSK